MANELQQFNLNKVVQEYSEKKGYTEGVCYYHKLIKSNNAVRNSKYYSIVQKFDAALKVFLKEDNSESLLEVTKVFPEYYENGELPELFESEELRFAFDNISEYLMNLSKIYGLDLH